MTFYELLNKVENLLEREGKMSYRALQREFEIDVETLDDIRQELVVVKKIARDIDGEMLELIQAKAPNSKEKKHILKWLGAALVLVGVILPWVTVRMPSGGINPNSVNSYSSTGLDLTQGLFSIAAGIIGAIAGLVANKKPLSLKWLSLLILIAGVVIIGFTVDVINGVSGSDIGYFGVVIKQNPEVGVFITLIGGCLLFFGGLASLLRKKKSIKKV